MLEIPESKGMSLQVEGALLATGQRILWLGNRVLQDVLFNAGIRPKQKKSTLSDFEKEK